MEWLLWIEESSFPTWVRTTGSVFGYPMFLVLHTVGLAIVAGVSVALDLRILGFAARLPLAPLGRFFPFIWFGFWVNAISGVVLLASAASTKAISGVFWIKLGFILLAVIVQKLIRSRVFNSDGLAVGGGATIGTDARILALASIVFWAGAITAGRLMAYIGAGAAEAGIV